MCFRPVEAALPVKCPACGTTNSNGAASCFKCGADLTAEKGAGAHPAGAPPKIPAVPAVLKAPEDPGAIRGGIEQDRA